MWGQAGVGGQEVCAHHACVNISMAFCPDRLFSPPLCWTLAQHSPRAPPHPAAKLYYTLLTYSADGLVATVTEKPHRFSGPEYLALLAANVVERPVMPEHRQQLQRVLTEAGRLAKPGVGKAALQGALAKAVKTFQRD